MTTIACDDEAAGGNASAPPGGKVQPDNRYKRRLTRAEELKHNVKDVWPEGAVFIGDAATLHVAGSTPGGKGARSLLDEASPACWFSDTQSGI